MLRRHSDRPRLSRVSDLVPDPARGRLTQNGTIYTIAFLVPILFRESVHRLLSDSFVAQHYPAAVVAIGPEEREQGVMGIALVPLLWDCPEQSPDHDAGFQVHLSIRAFVDLTVGLW